MSRNSRFRLSPSILSADFRRLEEQVRLVADAGADEIHVDVMDGHFVDNISMGPLVVQALRPVLDIPLDVHLMITDPLKYFDAFIDAGADRITFHVEANSPISASIKHLRAAGVSVGLALNPGTAVERVLDLVPEVDMMLVMTVHPGFGGQSFIAAALEKIPSIREVEARAATGPSKETEGLDVQVDGGIDSTTIAATAAAGANVFVAGSAIFRAPDPAFALEELRSRLPE